MRTIVWFTYFFASLIFFIPYQAFIAVLKLLGKNESAEKRIDYIVRWWLNSLLRLAGVRTEVSGKENLPEGAAVYVANHQGDFDVPLMLVHLGAAHGLIAKKEVKKIPFIGVWVKWIHCIFLDRGNNASALATMTTAVQQLKDGHSLIIFPEGTRSRGGPVKEFKAGAVNIAARVGVPIVPVCISGSYKALEEKNRIRPADCKVAILPPVYPAEMARQEMKGLNAQLQTLIEEKLAEISGE